MKTFKARGVVLREYEAGESDKRLTLLCKEYGRLTVYARGARKAKSKFIAAAQLFTYADFVLCDGRQFYSVAQADVIEGFFGLRNDYERLCHAHLALEVCEKTVLDNTPCDDLLLLLLKTLTRLSRPAQYPMPPAQVSCVFLFRFFLYYGLAPQIDECCVCGGALAEGVYFCDEGVVCRACAGRKPYRTAISAPALTALRHMLTAGLADAFGFQTSEAALRELTRAARLFWASHFQIKLRTEELIDGIGFLDGV